MLPQSICGRSQGLVMSAAGTIATTVCCKNSLKYSKKENFLSLIFFVIPLCLCSKFV